MNILIVTAHPSQEGFTHKIAQAYAQARKEHSVEILDLYKDIQQPFLSFATMRSIESTPERTAMQDKIAAADELIFIHPVWWATVPAIMKNYIDTNYSARFAFSYNESGKPQGLLKGKRARIFATCDSKFPFSFGIYIMLNLFWRLAVLGFCGVKVSSLTLFSNMKKRTDTEREYFLKQISTL